MPKLTGLGDNFYVGGYDLSGDVASVDQISSPLQLIEQTGLTQYAPARAGGKRDGTIGFTTFLNINTPVIVNPGVPASTTPFVNPYPYPCQVTISGGTLSSVKVNGVQVGTAAGTYTVPINASISITYTVLPTWNWFARGTEHDSLSSIPSADVVASYLQGNAVGNPACSMVSKQTNYDPTRTAEAQLTLKVEAMANGYGVEWGRQLTAGLRTDAGPVTGTAYDHGVPAGAYGAQAYLHLVQLVGTNVQVKVTHCATVGGVYADLIDFGLKTVIGGWRIGIANTTTVNQFLKVVSSGTFTSAVFAVNFVRNALPGTAF